VTHHEHPRDATAPKPYHAGWRPSTRVERTGTPIAWLALAGAVVAATGLGGDHVGGAKDGVLTLALAVIAGALFVVGARLKNRRPLIIGTVAAAFAAVVALHDLSDIDSTADDLGVDVAIGSGLWMVAIGATVALIAGVLASVLTTARTVPD
jgi:hypothetical protein